MWIEKRSTKFSRGILAPRGSDCEGNVVHKYGSSERVNSLFTLIVSANKSTDFDYDEYVFLAPSQQPYDFHTLCLGLLLERNSNVLEWHIRSTIFFFNLVSLSFCRMKSNRRNRIYKSYGYICWSDWGERQYFFTNIQVGTLKTCRLYANEILYKRNCFCTLENQSNSQYRSVNY